MQVLKKLRNSLSFTILIVSRRSPTKCTVRTKLLFKVPDELCENLDILPFKNFERQNQDGCSVLCMGEK